MEEDYVLFFQGIQTRYKVVAKPSDLLETLIEKLVSLTGIPSHELRVFSAGTPLVLFPSETVASLQLPSGAELLVRQSRGEGGSTGQGAGGGGSGTIKKIRLPKGLLMGGGSINSSAHIPPETFPFLDELPTGASPEDICAIVAVNPRIRSFLESEADGEFLKALREGPHSLRLLLQKRVLDRSLGNVEKARRAKEMKERLISNPGDVEAQRYLEQEIQKANIQENYDLAVDIMPEAFTRSSMLIVKLLVNGVPCQAMVDTGAQSTIISKRTAEHCKIMRLVDTAWRGIAKGVGTGVVLGRVHACSLQMGGQHFTASFTVMERDDMDFLLGLDFMRRFAAVVDLSKSELRLSLGGTLTSIPFLTERELSSSLSRKESGAEPNAGMQGTETAYGLLSNSGGLTTETGPSPNSDIVGDSSGGAAAHALSQPTPPSAIKEQQAPLFDLSSLLPPASKGGQTK